MKSFWQGHFSEVKQLILEEKKHFVIGVFVVFGVGYAIGGWVMACLMFSFLVFGVFVTPLLSWKGAFDDD